MCRQNVQKHPSINLTYICTLSARENLLCSPRLHLFDHRYSKNSNITVTLYNTTTILIKFSILRNF